MQKIIEGKKYNTETAELVAEWSNHYLPNDFHYMVETLYRTKKGSWFIHGEGGALSSYSEPVESNGSRGGEDIRPLTEEQAIEWLEDKNEVEALERFFADRIEEA